MIPFGSQRGSGQDLATHLLNTHDNEQVYVDHVRGAIANDLHGAFAEWALHADTLTKCKKYLYSLSINPDPAQDPLTRAQYQDYVARIELALGLADQPRAIVYHTKYGREHAHVVWSRVDAAAGKAVHIAYDREKLMRVTREFARDHGIELPVGYHKDRDTEEKSGQLSLYEKYQQETTGLTKEQRRQIITQLWQTKTTAEAFVKALGTHGYMLANGKRPYVLVDVYGNVNALPKLINDKQVRAKDVRAFLEHDFPPQSLPSVDEAKKLAVDQMEAAKELEKPRVEEEKAHNVSQREAERRKRVLDKLRTMKRRQLGEKRKLEAAQKKVRMKLRTKYLKAVKQAREVRAKGKIGGLAAFLGRVTGVEMVVQQVRRRNDKQRFNDYKALQEKLAERQVQAMAVLRERHRLQFVDMKRQLQAVVKVEKREKLSRDMGLLKARRIEDRVRKGVDHMQAIDAKRYSDLRKPFVSKNFGDGSDGKNGPGRSLDDWRGGLERLGDVFSRAVSNEKGEDQKDGRSEADNLTLGTWDGRSVYLRKRGNNREL